MFVTSLLRPRSMIICSLLSMSLLGLTGCLTTNSSAEDPSGIGHYDRSAVCTNLTKQIEFMQDQGYNITNQGASQVQMQQLMARYKANGCDK